MNKFPLFARHTVSDQEHKMPQTWASLAEMAKLCRSDVIGAKYTQGKNWGKKTQVWLIQEAVFLPEVKVSEGRSEIR